jgi:hypothetical protein
MNPNRYDDLVEDIFWVLHRRLPKLIGDEEKLQDIHRELKYIPEPLKKNGLEVVGWWYHLEFEYTPWEDKKKLYYRDNTYVRKKYLVQTTTGTWNLKDDIFKETFCK